MNTYDNNGLDDEATAITRPPTIRMALSNPSSATVFREFVPLCIRVTQTKKGGAAFIHYPAWLLRR